MNRRDFLAITAASAAIPSLPAIPMADTPPTLYIPYARDDYGYSFSPAGGASVIDLTVIPCGSGINFHRIGSGSAILDAGPLGLIAPTNTRTVAISDSVFRVARSTWGAFSIVAGSPTPCPSPVSRDIRLLIAGQSLGLLWQSSSALGAAQRRLVELGDDRTLGQVNVCAGGSAALRRYASNATNYWWDETNGIAGPLLNNALTVIRSLPAAEMPNAVLWIQGEQDSYQYAGKTVADDNDFMNAYANAVLAVVNKLRQASGCQDAIVQQLGPRLDASGNPSMISRVGMALVRTVQYQLVSDDLNAFSWGAIPDQTLPLRDNVHPTDAGFIWIGTQTARAIHQL